MENAADGSLNSTRARTSYLVQKGIFSNDRQISKDYSYWGAGVAGGVVPSTHGSTMAFPGKVRESAWIEGTSSSSSTISCGFGGLAVEFVVGPMIGSEGLNWLKAVRRGSYCICSNSCNDFCKMWTCLSIIFLLVPPIALRFSTLCSKLKTSLTSSSNLSLRPL